MLKQSIWSHFNIQRRTSPYFVWLIMTRMKRKLNAMPSIRSWRIELECVDIVWAAKIQMQLVCMQNCAMIDQASPNTISINWISSNFRSWSQTMGNKHGFNLWRGNASGTETQRHRIWFSTNPIWSGNWLFRYPVEFQKGIYNWEFHQSSKEAAQKAVEILF